MILDFLERILGSRWWDVLIVKLGAGAVVFGLIAWAWKGLNKRKERGRTLVDEARPDLAPVGNTSPRGQWQIKVENLGPGRAFKLRLRFTGTPGEATGGEVAPGKKEETQVLDVTQNPALTTAQPGLVLTIIYADRFGNDYEVALPVAQNPRADGAFNLDIPSWTAYQAKGPELGWCDYHRLGK